MASRVSCGRSPSGEGPLRFSAPSCFSAPTLVATKSQHFNIPPNNAVVAAVGWSQPVHYTMTVTNSGPSDVVAAPVTDNFSSNLTRGSLRVIEWFYIEKPRSTSTEVGSPCRPRAVGIAFIVAVGYSRLYVNAHWLSDVVGGLLAGLAFAVAAVLVMDRRLR